MKQNQVGYVDRELCSCPEKGLGNFDVLAKQQLSSLSRGERAGLNMAMALVQNPDRLILDEPILGTDVVAKQSFLESWMFIGADLNITVIYCSHQIEEVDRVADNLIIMENGRLRNAPNSEDFLPSGMVRWHL